VQNKRKNKESLPPGHRLDISELKQVTFLTTRTARVTSEDWVKGCDWLKTSTLLPVDVDVRVVKNVTCLSSLLNQMYHSVSMSMVFVSAIFSWLITICTRQMTRATFTAKIAAIADATPCHTFGGIQAPFCFDRSATDGKVYARF
jgi:hypothetical protein